MNRILLLACGLAFAASAHAQAVLEPPVRTMKCEKAQVNYLLVSPKGDRVLVGTDKGAELLELATGKRIHRFDFMQDKNAAVYYAQFNDNGEYVMLAGLTGKREVWDVKTGKREGVIDPFKWVPNSLAMKAIGLKVGNSEFDRYYQQETAVHGDLTAKADKNGTVLFTNKEGAAVQTLMFPTNKDVHYRAPCLFNGAEFVTGTDDGRVLFYTLR